MAQDVIKLMYEANLYTTRPHKQWIRPAKNDIRRRYYIATSNIISNLEQIAHFPFMITHTIISIVFRSLHP